ncbi:hypothetical protein Sj15T_01730 [Sphingobium sp. TA15]|uniref:Uncharacterized protein n=1 Tax=Sphingobium indicum (strain DSM 16413 / CCM 7287 / MTCC 6362 / UT26 / NBRC 101211 / UT26S) TaxID=452662 RepID=D4YZQ2_SPHIU|nr:hypothetical protein [Sphingobium indicum]BAI95834.1 hypothetical protein SJA_C1-10000 [Sphingobium indicum UT26S]BDD65152.1 hypothetical protein Sj15T_01730 [Sphingobium sp. TA15]
MAEIFLHPAARIRIEARLAEIDTLLAMLDGGLHHLLGNAEYRAATIANARSEGISLQEMHRRAVEDLRSKLMDKAEELRKQFGLFQPVPIAP